MWQYLTQLIKGTTENQETTNAGQQPESLDLERLPQHVAVIMDGNGRWATKRGLPRAMGHRAGVDSLRDIVRTCSQLGIRFLTVYAFSTENWKRPAAEINILMDLLVEYLQKEIEELDRNRVRVKAIGKLTELPVKAQGALEAAELRTRANEGLTLNLALNYGGRAEIIDAAKKMAQEAAEGRINPAAVDEAVFNQYLYTAGMPEPDLLIRPSGELRISNFLLWQCAYSEFWFSSVFWPDFRKEDLIKALVDYQHRQRRFGGLKQTR